MTRIQIYDTTLRDGSQGEGVNFSLKDKLLITTKLDELGFDSDTILKFDRDYTDLKEDLIYASNDGTKAFLVISGNSIHLIFDTSMNPARLDVIVKKYFELDHTGS